MEDKKELESEIMRRIQVKASTLGARLWRNNVGTYNFNGSWVKYGIQNPGGSDLIGFTQRRITKEMVGMVVPIFTAIEVKSAHGKLSKEQSAFIEFLAKQNAVVGVCRSTDELEKVIGTTNGL